MSFAALELTPHRVRIALMRSVGMDIHPTARVRSGTRFSGSSLSLGEGVYVNSDCFIENDPGHLTMKAGAGFAPKVMVSTSTHELGPPEQRWGAEDKRDVTIGEGVWVGMGAQIHAGVTIGAGCLIAAGAVVLHDCEPNGLYAGVPARRVKDLPLGGPPRMGQMPS